ncbi:MAG: hypothetical protein ACFFAU_20780 [Candidatus Hodarchaeota archaeon]
MQKVKLVFIDFQREHQKLVLDPFSTFIGYKFDKQITSRVLQHFGWTTDLVDPSIIPEYEISVHVIFFDYLRKYGITQLFISRHGREFDDIYSYIEGMSLLAFEGYTRAHTVYIIKSILKIIQNSMTDVPVDKPRIGILIPTHNQDKKWIKRIKAQEDVVGISDDIRLFFKSISPYHFIDYSLSRNYHYTLKEYIRPLKEVVKLI